MPHDLRIELTNTRQLYTTLQAWTREQAAEVCIASYSLGPELVRTLARLKARGRLTRLVCYLSRQAMQKARGELVALTRLCDALYLCHLHAKVVLLRYADGSTRTLISSQNATRSSSYECFVELRSPEAWQQLTAALQALPTYTPQL